MLYSSESHENSHVKTSIVTKHFNIRAVVFETRRSLISDFDSFFNFASQETGQRLHEFEKFENEALEELSKDPN